MEIDLNEPSEVGQQALDYNAYLRVGDLLCLQDPQSNPPHHDELLFITIHQSYELWFKLILHELEQAIRFIQGGEILAAHHFVYRIVKILESLIPQIHVLETMRPVDFLQFRGLLRPASGFQSIQFREVEFLVGLKDERYLRFFVHRPDQVETLKRRLDSPDLRSVFFDRLGCQSQKAEERIQRLLSIYNKPIQDMALYLLCESLISLDQNLILWRTHHVRVVERIIGGKMGTGGSSGVSYLESTLGKKCFPELWEVRDLL
jgi:tryptophan 2,3-dioxygenase